MPTRDPGNSNKRLPSNSRWPMRAACGIAVSAAISAVVWFLALIALAWLV